jgi:redox-sensing transcriptional repressor
MNVGKNIIRLLRYRMVLLRMQDLGIDTTYSYNLGREIGVTPEQVRKDFSQFGIKGKRKGGYNINELLFTINGIFRKNELQQVVLVGMGNIGNAVLQYRGFSRIMIKVVAGFDIDPAKYKKKYPIPVYPMEKLEEVVKDLGVITAVIAVPVQSAQEVCNRLVDSGIKGILCFAPIHLKAPSHVTINTICISHELEYLIYKTLKKMED